MIFSKTITWSYVNAVQNTVNAKFSGYLITNVYWALSYVLTSRLVYLFNYGNKLLHVEQTCLVDKTYIYCTACKIGLAFSHIDVVRYTFVNKKSCIE